MKNRDATRENISNPKTRSFYGSRALVDNFSNGEPREIPTLGILFIK